MPPRFKNAGVYPAILLFIFLGPFRGARIFLPFAWAGDTASSLKKDSDWKKIQSSIDRHRYPLAEKQIAQYVRTHPDKKIAYTLGGRIARKIHKPDSGLSIIDKGLARFHSDPTLLRLKAELLLERGDTIRSRRILASLAGLKDESPAELKKVREDQKALYELAMSMPPLVTFDQNINFQEVIPPPFQSPEAYILENSAYNLRVSNTDINYSGGASIGTGVAIESPLIADTVHFQAGTNLYFGEATGQKGSPESYLYGGVDGQGPYGIQFLGDAGDVFAGGQINVGLYGHVDIPAGPLRVDAQGWAQLPWSGYGEAIIAGGLQSGALLNATWSFLPGMSFSGEYEYAYDTLQGTRTPFGTNHNGMLSYDWGFIKKPDLHLIVGYDSQSFTPSVPNPTLLVPVLLSSDFGFAGFSSLDQIGRYVVLNGQLGGIVGTFDTPGLLAGLEGDGGLSWQIDPHFEIYGNVSYETLAASYIGSVTTMMFGLNVWF